MRWAGGRAGCRGDRRLGARHGPRRWAAARDDPGRARRPPRRPQRRRADGGQRGGQHRLRRPDRRAVADGGAARRLASRSARLARGPALAWWSNRRLAIEAPPPSSVAEGRLPGVFWIAAAMISARPRSSGASPPGARPSSRSHRGVDRHRGRADGRLLRRGRGRARRSAAGSHAGTIRRGCSRSRSSSPPWGSPSCGRRRRPHRRWPASSLLGIGVGNLFPMGMSVTVALAPGRAALASGRAVSVTSFAVLLAPLTVGALADATSLTTASGDPGHPRVRGGGAHAGAPGGIAFRGGLDRRQAAGPARRREGRAIAGAQRRTARGRRAAVAEPDGGQRRGRADPRPSAGGGDAAAAKPLAVGAVGGGPIVFKTKAAKLGDVEVHFEGRLIIGGRRVARGRHRAGGQGPPRPDQQEPDGARAAMGQGCVRDQLKAALDALTPTGTGEVIELDFLGRKLKLELARGVAGLPEFVIHGEFAPPKGVDLSAGTVRIPKATFSLQATAVIKPAPVEGRGRPRARGRCAGQKEGLHVRRRRRRARLPACPPNKTDTTYRSGAVALFQSLKDMDALPDVVKNQWSLNTTEKKLAFLVHMLSYFATDAETIEHFKKLRKVELRKKGTPSNLILHDEAATRLEAVRDELPAGSMPDTTVGWPRDCRCTAARASTTSTTWASPSTSTPPRRRT